MDEAKPITNQKSSGRCWLFACLNVIRIPFIKEYNLDDFEFSQGFCFFWDKVIFYPECRMMNARMFPFTPPPGPPIVDYNLSINLN